MLLKKANTITTPTAYSNGFLHSVKPEVVENLLLYSNDFSQTDWVQVSTTRTGGQLGYDGSNDAWELVRSSGGTLILNQSQSLSGVYTFSCYVKINAISGFGIGFGGSNYGLFNISDSSQTSVVLSSNLVDSSIQYVGNNFYRISVTANGSFSEVRFILASADGTSTSILGGTHIVQDAQLNKGYSAYPYLETTTEAKPSADFSFSRNSSGTRVNELGYIEDVQIIGGELVSNGDFEEIGSELVTNGSFDTDTAWVKQAGWTISGGTANFVEAGGNRNIYQSILTLGKFYQLTFTVSNYVSGSIRNISNPSYTDYNADGTYTEIFSPTTYTNLFLNCGFGSELSIDNVSVKEVGQDWTFGTGWSMGDGKAIFSDTANGDIRTQFIFTAGNKYRINLSVSDLTSGTAFFALGDGASSNLVAYDYYANGDYTFDVTAVNGAELRIYATTTSSSSFSIDNVSVKEVTDDTNLPRINYEGFTYAESLGDNVVVNGTFDTDSDWSKGTGWSISGGVATHTGGTASYLSQSVLEADTQYRVKIKVISADASNFVQIYMGNSPASVAIQAVGEYEYTFTSQSSVTLGLALRGVGEVQIDNVSVQEVIGNLPVPYSGKGHLLLEPQTSQILPYSEDFSTYSFTGTITRESGYLAPDGTNTAYKITNGGSGSVYEVAVTTSTTTRSIYARSVSGTGTAQLMSHNSNTNNTFTLTEQWQRFEVNSASGTGVDNFYAVDFRGGGTLSEVIIWGANATNDQTYATSYIPTNGTAVTRLGETCNNATQSFPSEGVLYAEIADLDRFIGSQISISINDGTILNRVLLYRSTGSLDWGVQVRTSGSSLFNAFVNYTEQELLEFKKLAIRYKDNDFSIWSNGVLITSGTSGVVSTGLSQLSFDAGTSLSSPFDGKTKMVATFPYLSNDEMECLTGEGYGTFEALAAAYSYTIK